MRNFTYILIFLSFISFGQTETGFAVGSSVFKTQTLSFEVYNGGYNPAIADAPINSADVALLDKGVRIHDGIIIWKSHGLTIGDWYYLDQTTAGAYTNTFPSAGIVQQLFFVKSADTILLDIEESFSLDVASLNVYLADDNARQAIVAPQANTIYTVLDKRNDGTNYEESWTWDGNLLQWVRIDGQEPSANTLYSDIVNGHVVGTLTDSVENGYVNKYDITETVTSLIENDTMIVFTREDGETDTIIKLIPFALCGIDNNNALVGSEGLTFAVDTANVKYPPINWEILSFGGDVQAASIDDNGSITYDTDSVLSNGGRGTIVVKATDRVGQVVVSCIPIKLADPASSTILACNGDLQANRQDIVSKLILFAKADTGSIYQDLAKTIPATVTGNLVSVLEDATGGGDLVTNNTAPLLQVSDPLFNSNNTLTFNGVDQSLEYAVPSPQPAGSPFKFFALVSMTQPIGDAKVFMSATFASANNSTGNGTWQIGSGTNNLATQDDFVIRAFGWTNVTLGTASGTDLFNASISSYLDFADGSPHLVYVDYDGTTVSLYLDGQLYVQGEPVGTLVGQYFKIFENRNGISFSEGKLAEMLYSDATMTDVEAIETQGYFLCKYGLDASLLAYASPFSVDVTNFYKTLSQFEYQVISDGTEVIYDIINNVYYTPDDVPTPGLGSFLDPILEGLRAESIINAVRVAPHIIEFEKGDGTTFQVDLN